MFTGKAYSRSVRRHFLCASAVQSTLIEELWSNLSPGDKEKLETYYHSNDPCIYKGEELAIRLKDLVEEKHKDLSKSSRTSALWYSYVRYVSVIQDFIRAERTNDWNLHVLSTNAMLNLFAARAQ